MPENKKLEPLTYSVNETALLLGVSRYSVYNQIKAGNIPYVQVGKLYRIPKVKLLGIIEEGWQEVL